jgi:hypothetical protein
MSCCFKIEFFPGEREREGGEYRTHIWRVSCVREQQQRTSAREEHKTPPCVAFESAFTKIQFLISPFSLGETSRELPRYEFLSLSLARCSSIAQNATITNGRRVLEAFGR